MTAPSSPRFNAATQQDEWVCPNCGELIAAMTAEAKRNVPGGVQQAFRVKALSDLVVHQFREHRETP